MPEMEKYFYCETCEKHIHKHSRASHIRSNKHQLKFIRDNNELIEDPKPPARIKIKPEDRKEHSKQYHNNLYKTNQKYHNYILQKARARYHRKTEDCDIHQKRYNKGEECKLCLKEQEAE